MRYLYKLFIFDPLKTGQKREFFISLSAIDYLTWYKKDLSEGTMIHTAFGEREKINHVTEGLPENTNQIIFDGAFFKCTCLYSGEKKYTAWINPNNVCNLYMMQPDSTVLYLESGNSIVILNTLKNVLSNLFEHNKKYKERKQGNYGNKYKGSQA